MAFFRPTRSFLKNLLNHLESVMSWRLSYSEMVIEEVCDRHIVEMNRLRDPDLYEQASHLCFWINKLKPILPEGESRSEFNEVFAFVCGQAFLMKYNVKVSPDISLMRVMYNTILHSLRYHLISPHALVLMYKMLYPPQKARAGA